MVCLDQIYILIHFNIVTALEGLLFWTPCACILVSKMSTVQLNPSKPNALSYPYQYEELFFIVKANSGYPDQTPRSAASDLGLHRLSMSHKKDAMLNYDLPPYYRVQ